MNRLSNLKTKLDFETQVSCVLILFVLVYQNKPTELVQEFKLKYPSTSHKTTNSNTLPTETIQLPMQLNHINQQQTVPKLYTFKLDHLPKPAVSSHFGPLLFPSNNNSSIPLS